ncbi:MAG TPA: sugar kinase, partial [Ideonella sp.]|nr:sugar kinase [Ideonella sp.]
MTLPSPPTATTTARIACFGECMIELRDVGAGLLSPGFAGDTCNTAVYLSRLLKGRAPAVRYAMGVGSDGFADGMRAFWRGEGLDDSLCRPIAGRSTGLYVIQLDAQGERHFSYWRDTSAARAYFDGESSPLEQAAGEVDVLYFSGISLAILPPAGRQRLLAVARRVRARGGWAVFDNNYRPRLWPEPAAARQAFADAVAVADLALISLDDWSALMGCTGDEQALQQVLALPCPEVVVKRGAADTLVRVAGQDIATAPLQALARPIDTTAAGDSFAAAYLAARLLG